MFSEFISLDEEIKPQLNKAINSLLKGDQLIITQLDRAFKNKKECLLTINKLINKDIQLRTLTGFFAANESSNANSSIFKILYELDNEDRKSLLAEYRELIMNDLDFEEVMMLPYEAYTDKLDSNFLEDSI